MKKNFFTPQQLFALILTVILCLASSYSFAQNETPPGEPAPNADPDSVRRRTPKKETEATEEAEGMNAAGAGAGVAGLRLPVPRLP